ncbi:MAG: SUMF1/EgtB/PvdO family nonheme iron enzyme [Proteobacteria bacterium]|nr:SUMF1/EgtB/PvdO family nonheme iron enzyme [Pseudomonadota bacterium]
MRELAVAFIATMLFVAGSSAARAVVNEDAVAVVIGNSNYTADRIPKVEYAHRDAAAFKRYLIEVLGYREGNIIDLRDATQAQMEAALGNERTHEGTLWQYVRADASDVTVFYSGHGVPGLKSKRGYLLPVNADPNKPEINGFPVDTLYANLTKLPARSVTVYLDACFSGDSPKGMLINATSGITITARLPKKTANLTILTAASGSQVASWDTENRHGLFTEHLLAALYGAADAPRYGAADGNVTLGEVKNYLTRNMSYAARRTYGRVQQATVMGKPEIVLAALGKNHPTRPKASENTRQTASSPSPSVQVDEIDARYIALKTATVRAQPTTTAAKVGMISADQGVDITGKVQGKDWYRVALADGGQGYVWGPLLSDRKPAAKPKADTKIAAGVFPKRYRPGDGFKDCADCPEMVVLPPGAFRMGDLQGGGFSYEKPVHDVRIDYSFAVGKFEVTRGEYAAFVNATGRGSGDGCSSYTGSKWEKGSSISWRDPGYEQTDRDPVACVNWDDAKAFVSWLSGKTGEGYRLLTETEWEYAARAGSGSKYSYGSDESGLCAHGNGADQSSSFTWRNQTCDDGYGNRTAPVGRYRANSFGLHDVHGNVWEWVEDCWHESYQGAPTDGSAWTSGGDCSHRVLRGGSWSFGSGHLRAASRVRNGSGSRIDDYGFRLARTLSP